MAFPAVTDVSALGKDPSWRSLDRQFFVNAVKQLPVMKITKQSRLIVMAILVAVMSTRCLKVSTRKPQTPAYTYVPPTPTMQKRHSKPPWAHTLSHARSRGLPRLSQRIRRKSRVKSIVQKGTKMTSQEDLKELDELQQQSFVP